MKGLPMKRVTALLAVVGWTTTVAPVALAAPDESGPEICTFTVTKPAVTILPGPGSAKAVTAQVIWDKCNGLGTPAYAVVCLSSATSSGMCARALAWNSAMAVMPSLNPTGQYRAEGQGCYRNPAVATLACDTATQTASF